MAKVTPKEYAEKWGRRMKSSTEDMRRGIDRVQEAPGIAAARAVDRLINNFIESVQSGKWAENVQGISLVDWKKSMTDKGLGRVAAGVDAAIPAQERMAVQLLDAVDSAKAKVDSMPKGSIEDSVNRMATFAREMHNVKIRKGR